MRLRMAMNCSWVTVLTGIVLVMCVSPAPGQVGRAGGGGRPSGARPSVGHVGGAGARPNISRPANMSRPSPGGANLGRPNPSRPSLGNAAVGGGNVRPATPRPVRPATPPSLGGSRPSLGGGGSLPNISRPLPGNTKPNPGIASRPAVTRPPVTRPTRPTIPDRERPTLGNSRPVTLPDRVPRPGVGGQRPGVGDIPVGSRPVNRPTTLPATRPTNRPVTLPATRPADRPVIGGNRPNFGGNTNINIGQIGNNINNNIGNRYPHRPSWDVDPGFSRPSWGLNNNWHVHWHNHCINHHHYWYNGCWQGYWGSDWYAPIYWGGVGWGLGSVSSLWGYNNTYYNPYYTQPVVVQASPYDYSRPVVVNNYTTAPADENDAPPPPQSAEGIGLQAFDDGLARFKAGDYVGSLPYFNAALKQLPQDSVVHEVRCLALYATGDYLSAAAGLNSVLSSAPGMDWTTISSLYGNPKDYELQLRRLEKFCRANPDDASARFVLAYHYLVTSAKAKAVAALRVVVNKQPDDVVARRMLDALSPAKPSGNAVARSAANERSNNSQAETDLVGSWVSEVAETTIYLTVLEDSTFTWRASSKGQAAVDLRGELAASPDGIELQTTDNGTMAGNVESQGPDAWRFLIDGAPPSDSGMLFKRATNSR